MSPRDETDPPGKTNLAAVALWPYLTGMPDISPTSARSHPARLTLRLVLPFALTLLAGCAPLGLGRGVPASTTAPDSFTVAMTTSKGPVTLMLHRDWAPLGVDRFYQLVRAGYYDQARVFRVVPGFVVQWGLAADSAVTASYRDQPLVDDSVIESNLRGTISFARGGRNSRTTQLFINLADNTRLDRDSGFGFPPIGEVISGMAAVDSFYSGYDKARPAVSQDSITRQGNAYLQRHFPLLDHISRMRIIKEYRR